VTQARITSRGNDERHALFEAIVTTLGTQHPHSASLIERGRKIASRLLSGFFFTVRPRIAQSLDNRARSWPPCRGRLQMQ